MAEVVVFDDNIVLGTSLIEKLQSVGLGVSAAATFFEAQLVINKFLTGDVVPDVAILGGGQNSANLNVYHRQELYKKLQEINPQIAVINYSDINDIEVEPEAKVGKNIARAFEMAVRYVKKLRRSV